jgi:ariadne-1
MLCGLKWKTCQCPWFAMPDLDAGDRLLNMPLPPNYQIFIHQAQAAQTAQNRARPLPPPPPPPMPAPEPRHVPNIPPPPIPAPVLHTPRRADERQAQERADEILARRLQQQLLLDSTPSASDTEMDAQMYGIGNAGRHHMNETYTYHSSMPVHTARRAFWGFARPVERRGRRSGSSTPPTASQMAGLSRDGSRRGAARVGTWLQHIQHDPAEVEVRSSDPDLLNYV